MSAFILSEDGFKQLASELGYHANYNHQGLQWAVRRFLAGDGVEREQWSVNRIAERVQALYEANINAVNQRYGDKEPVPQINFGRLGQLPRWSPLQLLKNLECLSYQMAEGDVPESEIYKSLNRLTGDIAKAILSRGEQWEQARWGW